MQADQQKIYDSYTELFDLAHRINQFSKDFLADFNKKKLKLFDLLPYQRILLFIVTRSLKTYSSIIILCENGYGQDVSSLLRSLLENLITGKYILNVPKKSDEMAKRFVAYKWVIFKRHLPEEEKNMQLEAGQNKKAFEARKKIILERVEQFKKTFSITSDRALVTWSGKTIRDMAKQIDNTWLSEYEKTFRLCSRFSHPSILGDQEYLIQEDKHLVFSSLPSHIGIMTNLCSAMKYSIAFLKSFDEIFDMEYGQKLALLETEMQNVFELDKYKEQISLSSQQEQPAYPIRECIVKFETNHIRGQRPI